MMSTNVTEWIGKIERSINERSEKAVEEGKNMKGFCLTLLSGLYGGIVLSSLIVGSIDVAASTYWLINRWKK